MHMNRVIVQVPMSKKLKEEASRAAAFHGLSSLQEAIRVLLTKLSHNEITLQVAHTDEPPLSAKAHRRYAKMIKDIEAGRNIVHIDPYSPQEFLEKLRS